MGTKKAKGFFKNFFGEFKKFITRGNIIDLSVGVIVGGAFTAIVNGLSNFILRPLINWIIALILGTDSLTGIYTYLKWTPELDEAGVPTGAVDLANSIYIDWGAFINAVINFLIIAFVLFAIVKLINRVNEASAKMQDMKSKIATKQSMGIKLSKKERKFLEEEAKKEEERIKAEEEAKLKLEEEAKAKAEELAKLSKTDALLTEILDILKNK